MQLLKKKTKVHPAAFFDLPAGMEPDELAQVVRKLALHGLIRQEGERWVITASGHEVLTITSDKRA
jgi:hypothetical protein